MSQRVNGTASPARQKLKRRSFVALGVAGGALSIAQRLTGAVPAAAAPLLPSLAPLGRSGVPRVGLQVGHWQAAELPNELRRLRGQTGAYAGGVTEVEVNLLVAEQVRALLAPLGIAVDLLPATISPGYLADAFVSLHADGVASSQVAGYKAARAEWRDRSWLLDWRRENPNASFNRDRWRDLWRRAPIIDRNPLDEALLQHMLNNYGAVTGLPRSPHVSYNMTGYYAFNSRRYHHTVSPDTPAIILEMGYLTNPFERRFLTQRPEVPARGVALGLLSFLALDQGFALADQALQQGFATAP